MDWFVCVSHSPLRDKVKLLGWGWAEDLSITLCHRTALYHTWHGSFCSPQRCYVTEPQACLEEMETCFSLGTDVGIWRSFKYIFEGGDLCRQCFLSFLETTHLSWSTQNSSLLVMGPNQNSRPCFPRWGSLSPVTWLPPLPCGTLEDAGLHAVVSILTNVPPVKEDLLCSTFC